MPRPALLFDLDGTLVDSAADIAKALSAVRESRGGTAIAAAVVRPLVSFGAETLVRRALGDFASDAATDLAAFRTVLRALPPDPAIIFPGVATALADLAAAGHMMAIVTNKPEALSRSLLEGIGLAAYFGAIVGGDTTAFAKPDRAPLDRALAEIGAPANCAIFIGDSDIDAAAARGCAMPFLLYQAGYGAELCAPEDVDARFTDFGSLAELIVEVALRCGFHA